MRGHHVTLRVSVSLSYIPTTISLSSNNALFAWLLVVLAVPR